MQKHRLSPRAAQRSREHQIGRTLRIVVIHSSAHKANGHLTNARRDDVVYFLKQRLFGLTLSVPLQVGRQVQPEEDTDGDEDEQRAQGNTVNRS